jgi:hypothetical protein
MQFLAMKYGLCWRFTHGQCCTPFEAYFVQARFIRFGALEKYSENSRLSMIKNYGSTWF